MVNKAIELAEDTRLVSDPPVRERGQCRHAFAHHREGDHRRFQRREARLLGHRLRHRRHAEGRRARACEGTCRTPRSSCASPAMRRCSPAAPRRSAIRTARPPKPHPAFKPHPMQGWSPDFIPKLTGDAVDMGVIDRIITIAGADAMQWSRRARPEGRHLCRHHGRRDLRRSTAGLQGRRRRVRPCCACCRTPASAIFRRRCLPMSVWT